MKKKFKRFLYRYLLPYVGLFLVWMISITYRIRIVEPENESGVLDRHGSIIYASWHQRFFPGIAFFAQRKPITIMISQSRDGDFIAHVVDILGWHPVRGSSSRGGRQALDELRQLASGGYKIGHIVDGPRGPFGEVKAGLVRIAQFTGKPVVPTITSGQRKWVFKGWDRFMVPKPFSRVIIRFGRPIEVPAHLDSHGFEETRRHIEGVLYRLYEETDCTWEHPEQIRALF